MYESFYPARAGAANGAKVSDLNLAFELGKLVGRMDALEAELTKRTLVAQHPVDPLSERVRQAIRGFARGNAELFRHLEAMALELKAKNTDDAGILDALERGSGG